MSPMTRLMGVAVTLVGSSLVSVPVNAQVSNASIAGTARDTTGALLPGVTIEAASPALIERVRTGVTDGTGQYRIIELRPGTYTVTVTLHGFNSFKLVVLQLTAEFTGDVYGALM